MGIKNEIQKADPSPIIDFYEVDATAIGGAIHRYHPGSNQVYRDLVWMGQIYRAYPVKAKGFKNHSSGQMARPQLTASNVTGALGRVVAEFHDFIGAKFTRRRTFEKYLDPVNFANGINPHANNNEKFPDNVFFISRLVSQDKNVITLELTAPIDWAQKMIPAQQVLSLCPWTYRGKECGYEGGPVADINDIPTSDPSLDSCSKRFKACPLRFGERGDLPFGGFIGPGVS